MYMEIRRCGLLNEAESGDEVVFILFYIINSIVEDVSKLIKDVTSDSGMSDTGMSKPVTANLGDGHCLINHGTTLTVRRLAVVPCLDLKISTEN